MKLYRAPKIFDQNRIIDFLKISAPVFKLKEKAVPDVHFDLSKVQKVSVTGLLIIYKFIDFSYHNYCFKSPNISISAELEESLDRYEFTNLIKAYISNKDKTEREYKKFKVKVEENFIIAPQALLRNTAYSYKKLQNEFLPKIEKHYSSNPNAVNMIFTCLSELLLNFWEHAKKDTKSIIIASGNKDRIEIACADTGEGIISSLGLAMNSRNLSPEDLINLAVKKGSTSKKLTNHMGYGLWIVDEIVSLSKSRLHIYSQGAYYKNDFGKKKSGKCGYWQGTIVTLILYLNKPKTICDIKNYPERELLGELKVNFI